MMCVRVNLLKVNEQSNLKFLTRILLTFIAYLKYIL